MFPNLFLIAGNGRKSGKTTLACRLIAQFRNSYVTAIKVSSHLLETFEGLIPVSDREGFIIYEETNPLTGKDTSRMLQSGAVKVYYIQISDSEKLLKAFEETVANIPVKSPIICESPSLINHVDPGVFAITINRHTAYPKDITEIMKVRHVEMSFEEITETKILPFSFMDGIWSSKDK